MKRLTVIIGLIILINTQQTYFGNNKRGCCAEASPMNPEINFDKNYIEEGDFEANTIKQGKKSLSVSSLSGWFSDRQFLIARCSDFEPTMKTQCLTLDPQKGPNSYSQSVNLTEGKYQVKFDYAPFCGSAPSQSSFQVYFNSIKVLDVRPIIYGVTTVTLTVNGRNGINTLEFVDSGTKQKRGGVIDNVGIHPWKTNANCVGEVQAVGAGYPVSSISVLGEKFNNYRLDSGEPGQVYGWCPLRFQHQGQWIQVSSYVPKLWNSVIVQGRGDYDDRMTKFKIQYTLDGKEWQDYGKVFGDTPPGNGKIRHNLKPFYAITIRLVTLEWCGKSSCFRFGATFINE